MSLIGTRTRFGRIAKWIGLCVSVVTAAGTLPASGGVALWVTRTGGVHVGTVYGTAYVAWRTKPCPISGYSGFVPEPGWNTLWYAHSWDDYLRPASTRFMTAPRSGWTIPQHRYVSVPLWMLSLASAMPIIWLWRRDRRFSAGHCQRCGYDLTGNTSGVCSECGASIGRAVSYDSVRA